jgi:hypothetical protein
MDGRQPGAVMDALARRLDCWPAGGGCDVVSHVDEAWISTIKLCETAELAYGGRISNHRRVCWAAD